MISLSFNLSPGLKNCLTKIDNFRNEILTTPLPPDRLLELRWKASAGYVTAWTTLTPTLRSGQLKQALDHIRQNWTTDLPKDAAPVLEYLNSPGLHPILQAAISHLAFVAPQSYLVPQVYLHRRGYDCQGLVCLDEFWPKNLDTYKQLLDTNAKTAGITQWVEFYAQAALYQFALTERAVLAPSSESSKGLWSLSSRQKSILAHLEAPGSSITNRQVQSLFKMSQITASRDLSKMATLGLLFAHGHGRSVYYTRI